MREQVEAQQRQVEALRGYARLARLRYDGGYTSYLEVLDAERSLFSADLAYTQTQDVVFQQRSASTRRWVGAGSCRLRSSVQLRWRR